MPALLSVERASLEADLTEAGWRVTDVRVSNYATVAEVVAPLAQRLGLDLKTDAAGHTLMPMWVVEAELAD